MLKSGLFLLALLAIAAYGAGAATSRRRGNAAGCRGMVKYNITFFGLWSRVDFPKQYPLFRPHAQWTKIVGRTHNNAYNLFRVNRVASQALKQFAELGSTEVLDGDTQGRGGILDTFSLPSLGKVAEGVTSGRVMVDGRHPRVSLVSRVVPSPDWFVGIDSFALCRRSSWIDSETIDLTPYDAGTDMGYTFTAPNWPETPPKRVVQITSKKPSHPANSFFYPELDELPPIARIEFRKVATYAVTQILEDETDVPALPQEDDSGEVDEEETPLPATPAPRRRPSNNGRWWSQRQKANKDKIAAASAGDCKVTDWTDWGPCSKTCGFGKQMRIRRVTQRPSSSGAPCPPLIEDQLCGSMRNCKWNYFSKFNNQ